MCACVRTHAQGWRLRRRPQRRDDRQGQDCPTCLMTQHGRGIQPPHPTGRTTLQKQHTCKHVPADTNMHTLNGDVSKVRAKTDQHNKYKTMKHNFGQGTYPFDSQTYKPTKLDATHDKYIITMHTHQRPRHDSAGRCIGRSVETTRGLCNHRIRWADGA